MNVRLLQGRLPGSARRGISLLELLVVVTILGILSAVIIPRFSNEGRQAQNNACAVHQGNIEVQCQLWLRRKGTAPQANLADIGADGAYFPQGLPTCPVDGTSYSLDTATMHVNGHAH